MFILAPDWLETLPDIKRLHKAVVVDNEDPEHLGRVKCTIDGILEGPKDKLPWISPIATHALGGRPDSSFFVVPEVDSHLAVDFPENLPYFGYYIGFWVNRMTHHILANVDYPESYGFRDKTNNFVLVNKKKNYFYFEHSSGTKLQIIEDGTTLFDVFGDYYLNVRGNKFERVLGTESKWNHGDVEHEYMAGYKAKYDTSFEIEVVEDMKILVGGDYNLLVTGAYNMDAGGGDNTQCGMADASSQEISDWPLDPVDIINLPEVYRGVDRPSPNV